MSQAKHHDTVLVQRLLSEAVEWFKEARKHPENKDREQYELARECANGAFKQNVLMVPEPRREIVARKFMEACQAEFGTLIPRLLAEDMEGSELDLELAN
jgi:hypothetical protein